jgi:amino-acid N-acetyltransferase
VQLRDAELEDVGAILELLGRCSLPKDGVPEDAELRGRRIASALCDEVERRARSLGVRRLYLLTETAETFFAKRGYRRVPRADAPPGIARSREFAAVCPASSELMSRDL